MPSSEYSKGRPLTSSTRLLVNDRRVVALVETAFDLAEDVLGLGRTSLEPPFVDREPELLRSWRGKIGVIRHPRRCSRRAEHNARIVKAGERTNRREPGTKPLVRRAAEPGREQHIFQLLGTGEMIEHDRRIDEGIVATG